jgi:hypothetical protein
MPTLLNLETIFGEVDGPHESVIEGPAPQADRINDQYMRRHDEVSWGCGPTRRLVGNGFPPHSLAAVPDAILADPIVLCPQCRSRRVLAELRELTRRMCYPCWEAGQGVRS